MKKVLVFFLLALMIAGAGFSQEIRASKLPASTATGTGADALKYADLLVMTSEIPVSFVRLENDNGTMVVNGQMSIGAAYVFMYGRGQIQADGSIANYRAFVFGGPVVSYDLTTDAALKVSSGLTLGAMVGMNPVSAIFGYDVIQKKIVIGLGFKVDLLTFTDATTVVLSRKDIVQ